MKLFFLFSSLMFVAFCEGIPTTMTPVPVSSKKVEVYIDDMTRTLTVEHTNALKLVKAQQTISLLKKQKLDVIGEKLSNITGTYNQLQKEQKKSLTDYNSYMEEFKQVQILIDKNKIDYESEIKFLTEIKAYIKKVRDLKCK